LPLNYGTPATLRSQVALLIPRSGCCPAGRRGGSRGGQPRARNHQLGVDELLDAERAWEEFWAAIRKVALTAEVEQRAGQLARSHALRGADAVHLASALAIEDDDLVIAVWDRGLRGGALASGLQIALASLPEETVEAAPLGPAPPRESLG
jgi:hypothetical protein